MEIKNDELKKALGFNNIDQNYGDAKISLFIVSDKYPRLKKLNLEGLTPDERAAKLHKWAESHRFVAVVEMGDQIFAHANAKFAGKLENQDDLTIEGKKVDVKTLSDEDSDLLDAVGDAFELYVQTPENKVVNEDDEKVKEKSHDALRSSLRQYYASQSLLSDQMVIDHWIGHIENVPSQVILNALKIITEARKEDEKSQEEKNKKDKILREEINRDIQKGIIRNSEIARQELKGEQIVRDRKKINVTRGKELDF